MDETEPMTKRPSNISNGEVCVIGTVIDIHMHEGPPPNLGISSGGSKMCILKCLVSMNYICDAEPNVNVSNVEVEIVKLELYCKFAMRNRPVL